MELKIDGNPLVVMTVTGRPETTEKVWLRLKETTAISDVLVLDNGSDGETKQRLRKLMRECPLRGQRVISWEKTLPNIASAVNLGLLVGAAEDRRMIVKLDNDILTTANWDVEMARVSALTRVGLVGIPPVPGVRRSTLKDVKYQNVWVKRPVSAYGVRFIWGGCFGIKGEMLNAVGFLDETLPRDEDWEYSQRAAGRGLNVFYVNDIVVEHLHPRDATEGESKKHQASNEAQGIISARRGADRGRWRHTVWEEQLGAITLEGKDWYVVNNEVLKRVENGVRRKLENPNEF